MTWALQHGIAPEVLAATLGIGVGELATCSLDDRQVARVWELLEEASGDPAIGLSCGIAFRADQMGPIGSAVAHAGTTGEALQVLAGLFPLLMRHAQADFVHSATMGGIAYRSSPAASKHGAAAVLAAALSVLRDGVSGALTPQEVCFGASEPADVEPYMTFFGAAPRWGSPQNALMLAEDDLVRPMRGASPAVSELLANHAPLLMDMDRGRSSVEYRVEIAFWAALEREGASLPTVAAEMSLSPRTLQRQLSELGLTFAKVRERIMKKRAYELLCSGQATIDAIAHELGYSNRTNFERAFFRWYQLSPAAARSKWSPGTR